MMIIAGLAARHGFSIEATFTNFDFKIGEWVLPDMLDARAGRTVIVGTTDLIDHSNYANYGVDLDDLVAAGELIGPDPTEFDEVVALRIEARALAQSAKVLAARRNDPEAPWRVLDDPHYVDHADIYPNVPSV
ncbi:MAG: hypothetical protein ACWA6X_00185 [Bauldia sp.]